jgi:hypothetical protein
MIMGFAAAADGWHALIDAFLLVRKERGVAA